MPKKNKHRICIDFDGVIHSYLSGWQGADIIPDPVVPLAIPTLWNYVEHFDVAIFSARSGIKGGIEAMKAYIDKQEKNWLQYSIMKSDKEIEQHKPLISKLEFPVSKPAAVLYIDDRGFRFEGKFPTVDKILSLTETWIDRAKSDLEMYASSQNLAMSAHVSSLIERYKQEDGTILIPQEKVESWEHLVGTHYCHLTEEEKNKDRKAVYDFVKPLLIFHSSDITLPPEEQYEREQGNDDA